jgi:hypothetical protein
MKVLTVLVVLGPGVVMGWHFDGTRLRAEAGVGDALAPCQDIDADGQSNLTDAVYLLSWLFRGGPEPGCPATKSQPVRLAHTGQTQCHDASGEEIPCDSATCPGQDAAHAGGCASEGRFVDNGDGTVTDNCTGLMWQKDTADTNGDGQRTSSDIVGWCRALEHSENLSFAGHDDWRLPNVRELQSIVDYGRVYPKIDDRVFGRESIQLNYWSSSSSAGSPHLAWQVLFNGGHFVTFTKDTAAAVRAVRGPEAGAGNALPPCQDIDADGQSNLTDAVYLLSWLFRGGPEPGCPAPNGTTAGLLATGQSKCYRLASRIAWEEVPCAEAACQGQDASYATGCPAERRFVDHGDGTVTDTCTGFMWQKETADTNGDGQSTDRDLVPWCRALEYSENLSFAGHDDWRLPNVRELQSIVDYGRAIPSIDARVFGPVLPPFGYWSSTTLISGSAFAVLFDAGQSSVDFKPAAAHYVRAVRSGP